MFARVLLCAAALLTAALPAQAQQAAPTEADIVAIKKDVTAAVDNYYALFSAHKMSDLPVQSFNIPWILLSGNGPQANLTKEQAQEGFEASLKNLVASGWGKSIFTTESVCVLSRNAAIASGFNTRYKTDGSVMSVGGVAYILGTTAEGWKIVSYSGITRGKQVKCD